MAIKKLNSKFTQSGQLAINFTQKVDLKSDKTSSVISFNNKIKEIKKDRIFNDIIRNSKSF